MNILVDHREENKGGVRAFCRGMWEGARGALSWHLSRIVTMRILPISYVTCVSVGRAFAGLDLLTDTVRHRSLSHLKGAFKKIRAHPFELCRDLSILFVLIDFIGQEPHSKTYRLAVDILLLVVSGIGSAAACKQAALRFLAAATLSKGKMLERGVALMEGMILGAVGGLCLNDICRQSVSLYRGAQIFDRLPVEQQEGVLRCRSIHHLSETPKPSRTLLLDGLADEGLESQFGGRRGVPDPICEVAYEHTDVTYARVKDDDTFCAALIDASGPGVAGVDHVIMVGHGRSDPEGSVQLGARYMFQGLATQMACLRGYLRRGGELVLSSCSTGENSPSSFAQRVANALPGIQVTGITSLFNPLFARYGFDRRGFALESYSWLTSKMNLILPFNGAALFQSAH